jgi:hypothetical protein
VSRRPVSVGRKVSLALTSEAKQALRAQSLGISCDDLAVPDATCFSDARGLGRPALWWSDTAVGGKVRTRNLDKENENEDDWVGVVGGCPACDRGR